MFPLTEFLCTANLSLTSFGGRVSGSADGSKFNLGSEISTSAVAQMSRSRGFSAGGKLTFDDNLDVAEKFRLKLPLVPGIGLNISFVTRLLLLALGGKEGAFQGKQLVPAELEFSTNRLISLKLSLVWGIGLLSFDALLGEVV